MTITSLSGSEIIDMGLRLMMTHLNDVNVDFISLSLGDALSRLSSLRPSILLFNPLLSPAVSLDSIRTATNGKTKVIAVSAERVHPLVDDLFDAEIHLYDSTQKIVETIHSVISQSIDSEDVKDLSPRERDVIIGIVKGLSNKEIASNINVSVHTVMTHRRNIARKLQIHSPAALTVYAIVKKLVKIEEIKTILPTGV